MILEQDMKEDFGSMQIHQHKGIMGNTNIKYIYVVEMVFLLWILIQVKKFDLFMFLKNQMFGLQQSQMV